MTMADWSERIPAAIEKAEGYFDTYEVGAYAVGTGALFVLNGDVEGAITKIEVALAKQLWATEQFVQESAGQQPPPPALIAFTEKIESL